MLSDIYHTQEKINKLHQKGTNLEVDSDQFDGLYTSTDVRENNLRCTNI